MEPGGGSFREQTWSNHGKRYRNILLADESLGLLTMFKRRCGVSCGSNYQVQFSWQVWDGQLSQASRCEKWPPTRPQFSQCRILGGKGWHEFVLQEAQLLFGQCMGKVCGREGMCDDFCCGNVMCGDLLCAEAWGVPRELLENIPKLFVPDISNFFLIVHYTSIYKYFFSCDPDFSALLYLEISSSQSYTASANLELHCAIELPTVTPDQPCQCTLKP